MSEQHSEDIEKFSDLKDEYRYTDSYTAKKGEFDKCLLLFSGGLDTSCMLKWIRERYECDVYTLTLNLGQSEDFSNIKKKAYNLGAKKHFYVDARQEFVENYCWKAVKANAFVGRNGHPISSSLTRPLIVKKAVEIAKKENISVISHGASSKSNDSLRFDINTLILYPKAKIIAPVREWGMGREAELKYAKKHNIEVVATPEKSYSVDDNIWGRETEAGILNYPDELAPDEVYSLVKSPEKAPEKAVIITIDFLEGLPFKVNGKHMPAIKIVETLNSIGKENGIGIFDFMEERGVGFKVREIHESPAAEMLIKSHIDLEELNLTKEELRLKRIVENQWLEEALNGFWFVPLMNAMNAFIDELNHRITGTVRLKIYKGKVTVVSRNSPFGLDLTNLLERKFMSKMNDSAVTSFIELSSLQRRASKWMGDRAKDEKYGK